jgi:hypothetical protein
VQHGLYEALLSVAREQLEQESQAAKRDLATH